jgi:hypothetical protein
MRNSHCLSCHPGKIGKSILVKGNSRLRVLLAGQVLVADGCAGRNGDGPARAEQSPALRGLGCVGVGAKGEASQLVVVGVVLSSGIAVQ